MPLKDSLESLRRGGFVLVHDSAARENEVDMVAAAGLVTPEHVARMRTRAGGLICLALDSRTAAALGLRYMHEILAESMGRGRAGAVVDGASPYGDRPAFSISVNHRRTYTGVTDADRALTMREMAALHARPDPAAFASSFRAPGHVPLLIASEGLLGSRRGHTEMSVFLAQAAGLAPMAAVCEMMDSRTHSALSAEEAAEYAGRNAMPFIDGAELLECAGGAAA